MKSTQSAMVNGHRRASSSSTVRAAPVVKNVSITTETLSSKSAIHATLWVHDDSFSSEDILINPSILIGSSMSESSLIEVAPLEQNTAVLDFEDTDATSTNGNPLSKDYDTSSAIPTPKCLCIVKFASQEVLAKHQGLEVSVTRTIAEAFRLHSRNMVVLKPASLDAWTASHIELSFRDAYLARSDMWRFVSQALVNKVVYKGQKISFLGTMKLTVKEIHVKGHRVSTGFFSPITVPVFRSEAARYVLFIQMSQEMWDFDSEGNGEIMFNRVINGFLPQLFQRWVELEVRHLVSIVMFGRLQYDRYDFADSNPATAAERFSQSSSTSNSAAAFHQDFFRVVVTDMASAQWTTILNELKKDFQVFLRDISLHAPVPSPMSKDMGNTVPKITGRPSTALKGNILEAINMASSQFANDYIDRDLIRTGVSTIVITAGTGVFDVDRDLLNLTSENLTNNGIGIDVVCLSKMPLHSVPLFRYRLPQSNCLSRVNSNLSNSSHGLDLGTSLPRPSVPSLDHSSALSSFTGTSLNYFSRFPSAFPSKLSQPYGYGVPHWIDLSYWSPSQENVVRQLRQKDGNRQRYRRKSDEMFVPRVRMYQLQMMGLMELGMADISIPYIVETPPQLRRPKHKVSADLSQLPPSVRNVSQSPSYFRKASALALRHKESVSAIGQRNTTLSTNDDKMMDDYDDLIFLDTNARQKPRQVKKKKKQSHTTRPLMSDTVPRPKSPVNQQGGFVSKQDFSDTRRTASRVASQTAKDLTASSLAVAKAKSKTPRISRSISYALRGLPTPHRSSTKSDVSADVMKALPSMATTSLTQASAAAPSVTRVESVRNADLHEADSRSIRSADSGTEHPSKPISIGGTNQRPVSQQVSHKLDVPVRAKVPEDKDKKGLAEKWPSSPSQSSDDENTKDSKVLDDIADSVPHSTLPFIRNVNASNPLKRHLKADSIFGRWQHLYPHKPRASTVKWRSLCTPASVPLTTEDFPSVQELQEKYETRTHRIQVRRVQDVQDAPLTLDALLFEMLLLRLSHGYQIIIGNAVRKVIGKALCEISAFLDPTNLSQHGDSLLMGMGNTIQKLSFDDPEYINVTKYVKKPIETEHPFAPIYSYNPNIRTILATDYWSRTMQLMGFSEEYPWEVADNYLADGEVDTSSKVKKLRFWRARFVLLPVEPPSNTWRPQQSSDDNDEEIHLLGIRALTQMWQKARYLSASERKIGASRTGNIRKRDQNPLEIKFETLNPSELVATELDKLIALEESGEIAPTQILPDSEKLDRDSPTVKLAHAIQGDKGIEIKNRRWHLRLHYNCFNGEEFTNWLLHNVKNIETRDEAVELGNQLMKEGLFEHVNGRHYFKDGNYFYSLKQEFRVPRAEIKGSWFPGARRTDRSVPPTPLSEHPTRELPHITTRSRSGSSLAYTLNPATPLDSTRTFLEKRKRTVTLTKMIKLDIDPRKRSKRPEIINLHYDRFHNPENCYHIELSWLNTTSKLVDDAIVSWTSQAEKYGLKLVEVPIAEASKIPDSEPFRRAYQIKLMVEPPKRQVVSHVLTSSSFTPQPCPNPDKHIYQKAILKHFNFVLDLEGSSEFPENVDIQYSSAGLNYQYTQFVHRSGVILAQITDSGNFLLLANRLYNARFANSKETTNAKYDKREPTLGPGYSHRPAIPPPNNSSVQLQASGIIGLNMHSPGLTSTLSPSPMARVSADVFGSRSAISSTTIAQYVTPEQIKDEIEQFCNDPTRLEQFYKDFNAGLSTNQPRRGGNGTSSSVLKPIPDANEGIPEFVLPESVASTSTLSSGFGLGFGGLMSRRARASVAYDSVAEMFGRASSSTIDRAEGSRDRLDASNGTNSGEGSGRTSGNVSGQLDLRVRVDTPGGSQRIEEGIEEGMKDYIGSPVFRP